MLEREREKDKGKVKWMGEGRLNQTVGGQRSLRRIMEDGMRKLSSEKE